MRPQKTSPQHPEIGSVATRMLWIPAVASILVISYVALHAPQDDRAPTALASAHAAAPVAWAAPSRDATPRWIEAIPAVADEALAAHEALDPVGAGHDVAH